jgi:hypothetical protein
MRQRCENPNHAKFHAYGAKGISVCERWRSFENFLADMGERPEGRTIDRVDGGLGYFPENCRWSTPRDQQGNLRTNRFIEYDGERMTLSALARKLGIQVNTLTYRIDRGWPQERWGASAWQGNRYSHR